MGRRPPSSRRTGQGWRRAQAPAARRGCRPTRAPARRRLRRARQSPRHAGAAPGSIRSARRGAGPLARARRARRRRLLPGVEPKRHRVRRRNLRGPRRQPASFGGAPAESTTWMPPTPVRSRQITATARRAPTLHAGPVPGAPMVVLLRAAEQLDRPRCVQMSGSPAAAAHITDSQATARALARCFRPGAYAPTPAADAPARRAGAGTDGGSGHGRVVA